MRCIASVFAGLTASSIAAAQLQSYVCTFAPDGEWVATPADDAATPAGPPPPTIRSYDNWRPPTLFPNRVVSNGAELADDIQVASWQPNSYVADIGWTLYNSGPTTITRYRRTLRFYDGQGTLLSTSSGVVRGNFGPGTGAFFSTSGGSFLQAEILITPQMFLSVQYSEVEGGRAEDLGVLSGGPITLGSSSNFIYNFTTGQQIDLGPNNNLGFFIDAVVVPAPAGAPLLAVGVLAMARRRRDG
ncbi:MAG: hypothetical protein SFZ23_04750 [Planctomycetota bacterium]|nr:hypothetical protein [Planctomycetota bacterium]